MEDRGKTKRQLVDELAQLRQQIAARATTTQFAEVEEALRRRVDELAALQSTVLDIAAPHDLPTLLQTIVERATRLLNAPCGGLYLCDPERREARCVVSYNTPSDYTGTVLRYGEGMAGTVAQTEEPLIVDDYRTWSGRAAVYEEEQPFRAVLGAPMLWRGQVTGVIIVLHDVENRRFTNADLELLTLFANHAAIAVENARLYEQSHRSEEEYRNLIERANDGIVIIQDTIIQYVNLRLAEMWRVTPEQLVGTPFTDHILPDDLPRMAERYRQRVAGKVVTPNFDAVLRRADGSKIYAEMNAGLVTYRGKPADLVIVRDVTERRRAEEELRQLNASLEQRNQELATLLVTTSALSQSLETEPTLRQIAESAAELSGADGCGIYEWAADGQSLVINVAHNVSSEFLQAILDAHLQVGQGAIGRSVANRAPVEFADVLAEPGGYEFLPLMTAQGYRAVTAVPMLRGDDVLGGICLWRREPHVSTPEQVALLTALANQAALAISNAQLFQQTRRQAGERAALIEIGRDISASLNLQTVLERIAAHAQNSLEASDSDVYLLDPENQALRAVVSLGDYADEIRAMPLRLGEGVVGYVAQSGIAEVIDNVEKDPRSVQVPETPEGESETLMCAPLISKDRVIGVMVLGRPCERGLFGQADLDFLIMLARQAAIAIENARLYVAEQQHAETLSRALEQQQELDRLKSEFIQNVSHEFRTPLAIIMGYAELLKDGEFGALPSEQREPVEIIVRRVRGLREFADYLTAILEAEGRELRREPVDLAQLSRAALADFQVTAAKSELSLTAEIIPDALVVPGDAQQLRRVLDNLLSNACKFTPANGRVTIRLRQEPTEAVWEVSDTGIGIAREYQEHLFQRFYQVNGSMSRRHGGTGLGLALVKEIVEAHGGQVTVKTDLGKGSTFTVRLPT